MDDTFGLLCIHPTIEAQHREWHQGQSANSASVGAHGIYRKSLRRRPFTKHAPDHVAHFDAHGRYRK